MPWLWCCRMRSRNGVEIGNLLWLILGDQFLVVWALVKNVNWIDWVLLTVSDLKLNGYVDFQTEWKAVLRCCESDFLGVDVGISIRSIDVNLMRVRLLDTALWIMMVRSFEYDWLLSCWARRTVCLVDRWWLFSMAWWLLYAWWMRMKTYSYG